MSGSAIRRSNQNQHSQDSGARRAPVSYTSHRTLRRQIPPPFSAARFLRIYTAANKPGIEAKFLPDSYGYRPGRSALDAVGVTRERCWKYSWVLEFDIKGLFDNIDHALLDKGKRAAHPPLRVQLRQAV
jgi:hypothetical protein